MLSFSLLLLISVFITSEKEKHTHDADAYAKRCHGVAVASVDRPQGKEDCTDSQRYAPSWESAVVYRIFGWPEGITAWALFATLAVIGWQSHETRRSAAATEKAATATEKSVAVANRQIEMLKDKERARFEVKPDSLNLTASGPNFWYFASILKARNIGISRAYIKHFQAEIVWSESKAAAPAPNIPDQGNLFIDSYLDPTEDWDVAPPSTVHFFNTDSINLSWFASAVYEGRVNVLLRGVVEYGTVGTVYRRFFCFEWQGHGRPNSVARALAGGALETADEGKMSSGYWRTQFDEEEEKDSPNPN